MDDRKKTKEQLIAELEELRKHNAELEKEKTERKLAEEKLEKSQTYFIKAQEMAKLGSFAWDSESDSATWSDQTFHIFGFSPNELQPSFEWLLKVLHPDDRELVVKRIEESMKTGKSYDMEYRIVRRDGKEITLHSKGEVIFNDRGESSGVTGIIQDITERKRAEESLRESEEKFRSLFNNAEIGIFRTRLDGSEILDMNDKFIDTFGYTREEMKGKPSVIHWVDPCERIEMVTRLTAGGRVTNYECRMFNKQGDVLTCITSLKLYKNLGILEGSIIDITDRVKAEEEIKETQLLLKSSIESPKSMIIFSIDKHYRYLLFNKTHKANMIHAYGKHVKVGMNLLDCITDTSDVKKAKINFDKALSGEFHSTIEEYGDRERSYYETLYSPIINEENVVIGATAFARDITERKKAEESLRESEKKYRTLFERESDAIFIYDPNTTNILDANEATSKMYGYDKDELIGMSCLKLSAEVEESTSAIDKIHEDVEVTVQDRLHRKKDGTIFPVDINGYAITLDRKNVMFAVSKDITARKRAEEEKAKLEEQYRQSQKVESIGRLAGGMAHDLNNLLVPIIGYAELLMDDFDPDDERRGSADEIMRAGFRARDLVQQLLAFSRKQLLQYKTLDMNKVIEEFEKLLRRTIREDIEIETILSPDIQTIRADIVQIEQVIMNLCVNAQDAMPDGGKLVIETSMVKLDETYAADHPGTEPGAYVMLAMSDTGCGMDEETQALIFEPFYSTKGELGTGLGLSTVYGIVKQHGGNIWVYSEPGKGTTFKIYLPVSPSEFVEENILEDSDRDRRGSETILLAEDDEQVRNLSCVILKKQGYTVLAAENGDEALAVLASHHGSVHLLFTDVIMPGMNGNDLYAKAAEKYPKMKALFMSGYADNVVAHHGVMAEGVQFIQKPFSPKALAAKVREVLDIE